MNGNVFGFNNLGKWLSETDRKLNIICENIQAFNSRDIFSFSINKTFKFKHCDNIILHKIKTNIKYNGFVVLSIVIDETEYDVLEFLFNNEYIDMEINKHLNKIKNKELKIILKDELGNDMRIHKGYVYIKS